MGTYSNSRFSYYERNRNSCALQKGLSDRTESRMYPRIAVRLDASKPERKLDGATTFVMRVRKRKRYTGCFRTVVIWIFRVMSGSRGRPEYGVVVSLGQGLANSTASL